MNLNLNLGLSAKDIQDAIMLTLLVTAALLALVCDITRIQALLRARRGRREDFSKRLVARTTLVPPR